MKKVITKLSKILKTKILQDDRKKLNHKCWKELGELNNGLDNMFEFMKIYGNNIYMN